MTTRQATLASPTHSQPPYENHHGDLSSLDFLSLTGLDESGVPEVNGFEQQPEAGPSNFNTQGDRRDSVTDDREGYSEARQVNASMDVDLSSGMEGMDGLMGLYGQDYDAVQSGLLQRHVRLGFSRFRKCS